jgi:hypothetical protein
MLSAAYYRGEADRCHKLAEEAKDPDVAAQWRKLARDYNALVDVLEATTVAPPPSATRVPMQQQAAQTQQSKAEPEEDKSAVRRGSGGMSPLSGRARRGVLKDDRESRMRMASAAMGRMISVADFSPHLARLGLADGGAVTQNRAPRHRPLGRSVVPGRKLAASWQPKILF